MTTLRNQPPPPETEEERVARIERTLRGAASWQPETEAPNDLCARLAHRLEQRSLFARLRNGITVLPGGWGTLSAAGLCAAAGIVMVLVRNAPLPIEEAVGPNSLVKSPLIHATASPWVENPYQTAKVERPPVHPAAYLTSTGAGEAPRSVQPGASEPRDPEPRPRRRPVRLASHRAQPHPTLTAAPPSSKAAKPAAPVWHYEESPEDAPQEDDSSLVQVPVVLTQTDANGEVTNVPAIMQMKFGQTPLAANGPQ